MNGRKRKGVFCLLSRHFCCLLKQIYTVMLSLPLLFYEEFHERTRDIFLGRGIERRKATLHDVAPEIQSNSKTRIFFPLSVSLSTLYYSVKSKHEIMSRLLFDF